MKKKLTVIVCGVLMLAALILFLPIPKASYDDGGTREFDALLYKVVRWNRLTGADSRYSRTSVYFWPDNRKSIDELWKTEQAANAVPDDFEFSLVWGCYGDSSYDSATGTLVKQKAATAVEDYTTTYILTDAERREIYELIRDMEPETYPDSYNPLKGCTEPSRTIILTVRYQGVSKTIVCEDVSLSDDPNGKMGKKFMEVHDRIVEILTFSDAWKALPEYEFLYC